MTATVFPTRRHSRTRQTVQVSAWVKPAIKAELQRIAAQERLSLSQTCGTLLAEAIRQKLHVQHAVLLQPIIETTIRKELSRTLSRVVLLLLRIAYEEGQTRRLVTNILGRQPGVTPALLEHILDASSRDARNTIFLKTPQLASLIDAFEQWLREEEGTNT
jgi:hypothetical protein